MKEPQIAEMKTLVEEMTAYLPHSTDPKSWQSLAEQDLKRILELIEDVQNSQKMLKTEHEKTLKQVDDYRAFVRGDHTITLDYKDASEFFRMNRNQESETYTVRLADLYRLASDKRGRDEQDEEDAR